jgi:hypothetical protein
MTATLVILRDPAGILGREVLRLHADAPLQRQIEAAMPGGAQCELLINGERADPMTDPRLDAPPKAGDCIVVAHRPAGVETWVLIISALLAVASYAMIPKVPDAPVANDGPNNRLTGQSNVARAYQAIPDVYGRRRVWPDLIQPAAIEYRNNHKRITHWLCISRGLGAVTDMRLADTPIDNILGAEAVLYEPGEVPPVPPGVGGSIPAPPAPSPALPGVPPAYAEAKQTRLTDYVESFRVEGATDVQLTGVEPFRVVEAGNAMSFVVLGPSTLVRMTFEDGPQWAQVRAAAMPLTLAEINFRETAGSGSGTYTGSITAVSTTGGIITVTISLSAIMSQLLPFTVTLRPSGTAPADVAGPYTLPISDANAIRLNFVFPRGLKSSAGIGITLWRVDSVGAIIPGSTESSSVTYNDDTFDPQFKTLDIIPAGGPGRYVVSASRTDVPATDGSDLVRIEAAFALRKTAIKDLPIGATIVRFVVTANAQGSTPSDLKFNLVWERKVRTLAADTASISRNAFRSMAHLWTIGGQPLTDLDTAAMQAINTALGEGSPMLRFDGSLDDADVSLLERMQLIANHARCVFWRDGTKWTVTRDQARSAPELQLDYRNLAGSGQSVVSESFHLPASQDGVEVEFVDEATGAKKAYYRLNITSGSPVVGLCANPLRVKLPACTTLSQATNRAQLEARKLLYQRTSVTDTALGDAQQLGPGSLVRWVDPNDFAGDDRLQAGEVLAIDGSIITTSEPLDFKGQTSGRIQVTNADGMLSGPPVVCTPVVGDAYRVTLASVPVGLFVAAPPASQVGSRYAFAVGLTQAEVEAAGLYTVTEPRPNGDGTWALAMVNYDLRVYAAD